VQRRATVAAEFSAGIARAQPVASRRAFRIDALHSPARQILQCFPHFGRLQEEPAPAGVSSDLFPIRLPGLPRTGKSSGKVAGILRFGTCGVKSKDTIPSGAVAERFTRTRAPPLTERWQPAFLLSIPAKPRSPFTTLPGLPTICDSGRGTPRKIPGKLMKKIPSGRARADFDEKIL
jgi:hypothetical protein